jgi:hypothetical protein
MVTTFTLIHNTITKLRCAIKSFIVTVSLFSRCGLYTRHQFVSAHINIYTAQMPTLQVEMLRMAVDELHSLFEETGSVAGSGHNNTATCPSGRRSALLALLNYNNSTSTRHRNRSLADSCLPRHAARTCTHSRFPRATKDSLTRCNNDKYSTG